MRLGHVVKSRIIDFIERYQGYIDEMVENTPMEEIDNYWWDKKQMYAYKIEVLEELLEDLDGK